VLVVTRFRVSQGDPAAGAFRDGLAAVVDVLAGCPGFVGADTGRNLDDPELWVLVTRWDGVGSYRRALSSYDAKVALAAVQAHALDEPSAYEPGTGELNRNLPR